MAKKIKPKDRKNPLQVEFGKILREKRLGKKFSQEKLAHICGLHFTYISSAERGERNVSLQNLAKIARGIGCQIKDIVPDID